MKQYISRYEVQLKLWSKPYLLTYACINTNKMLKLNELNLKLKNLQNK